MRKRGESICSRQASWEEMFSDFYSMDPAKKPANPWWESLILKPVYFVLEML